MDDTTPQVTDENEVSPAGLLQVLRLIFGRRRARLASTAVQEVAETS